MNNRLYLPLLCALSFSTSAQASDERLRTTVYDPERVVRVAGRPGIQSTIQFGPDERIENVAVGDSSAWQVTPNRRGSIIFVKPLSALSRTNMTVVTDRRTYLFDLVSVGKDGTPLYSLKFSYPADEVVTVQAEQVHETDSSAEPFPIQAAISPDRLNFHWKAQGSKSLAPSRIFDDGHSIYVAWDRRTPLPAILSISEAGEEGPLHYEVSGEYIVISPVLSLVVLRHGKNRTELRRLHPVSRPIIRPAPASNIPLNPVAIAHLRRAQTVVGSSGQKSEAALAAPAQRVDQADVGELLMDNLTGVRR